MYVINTVNSRYVESQDQQKEVKVNEILSFDKQFKRKKK